MAENVDASTSETVSISISGKKISYKARNKVFNGDVVLKPDDEIQYSCAEPTLRSFLVCIESFTPALVPGSAPADPGDHSPFVPVPGGEFMFTSNQGKVDLRVKAAPMRGVYKYSVVVELSTGLFKDDPQIIVQ